MPGQHPDDDLLADLAADVLPLDQARAVEAHVMSCDRCASLLSDAEHVRGLLLADDAGPVPPEIWHRIEAALRTAAPSPSAEEPQAAPPPPPPPPPPLPVGVDRSGPRGWDGPDPLDDPDDWTTSVQPKVAARSAGPAPVTGKVRALSTSRRDVRRERRRIPSGALLVGAAAAVVLLLAGGTVRLLPSGHGGPAAAFDSKASSGSASSAAVGAGSAATAGVITRSNTDYTSATLAERARALRDSATASEGANPQGARVAPTPGARS